MDAEALDTFLAVYREGGFSKAARLLHRTQPAISRRISLLERELGDANRRREGARDHVAGKTRHDLLEVRGRGDVVLMAVERDVAPRLAPISDGRKRLAGWERVVPQIHNDRWKRRVKFEELRAKIGIQAIK